jgi:hypothetical protein
MGDVRVILGLTESITILGEDKQEQVTARIDTGATASSIDLKLAENLNLKKIEKIKLVKSASGVKKRPVVIAKVKLNGDILEEEFTIADRSHMTYPLLIGQNILKRGNFLIDPNKP